MTTPFHQHDHRRCIDQALRDARQLCIQRGVRLTRQREQVLRLIWQCHQPMGAYDLLDALAQLSGKRTAPPTIYRALDFLQQQGLIHKITSLNAFIGCSHPDGQHGSLFLICERCRKAEELPPAAMLSQIQRLAHERHFDARAISLEIVGYCQQCQEAPHE